MVDVLIVLIKQIAGELDEFNQPTVTETRTDVFAASVPVSRSEYYRAGEKGIRPEFEFEINPAEYHGETIVEYTDETGKTSRLRIYRTYEAGPDKLELYCSAAAGLNERAQQ